MTELTTERLLMRQWKADDYEPFAAMNADPAWCRDRMATCKGCLGQRLCD
ncbi:hypothetical protein [Kribbella deserti]|uniref:GNAT family N-acetyltransferase n=1 Tax=Kribbella deserti TaxID=1926257 RepID=A0ABV6QFF7_9ACTN